MKMIKLILKPQQMVERLNNAFDLIYQTAKRDDVLGFLHCLWKVRYQFDKWVVKWVEKAEESSAVLRVSTVNYSKTQNRLNRTPSEITSLSQLQSVRLLYWGREAHSIG